MSAPRTLVIAPNWVGDNVMALPVLEALAVGGRSVHVLARPHLLPLLELFPPVAGAVARSSDDGETIETLRALDATEAVILPNSFRSAWFPYRAGIAERWGYVGGWRRWMLRPAVARPRSARHQVDDYRELLQAMSVEVPETLRPRLPRNPALLARGADWLERAGLRPDGRRVVGFFPGAEFGPSKRWPIERFAAASKALRRSHPDVLQVVLAGPKEVWLAVRLHELTGKVHPVLGPDLDLLDFASVLARLDGLLTNDSGPMHLAAAFGVPCVAPFGPTDPLRTAPVGPEHRILHRELWCSPCFRRRCPLLHHRCMKGLPAESATDGLAAILDEPAEEGEPDSEPVA